MSSENLSNIDKRELVLIRRFHRACQRANMPLNKDVELNKKDAGDYYYRLTRNVLIEGVETRIGLYDEKPPGEVKIEIDEPMVAALNEGFI